MGCYVSKVLSRDLPPGMDFNLTANQIGMLAFNFVLGFGLFTESGRVIAMVGPGSAVFVYLIMCTYMWSVTSCQAEMAALFPVMGPNFEFVRRMVDDSVGLSLAWLSWFSWVGILAAEGLAIRQAFQLSVPAYSSDQQFPGPVEWGTREQEGAIWIALFFVVVVFVNLLPAKAVGHMAYWSGWLKILFVVALIIMNVLFSARRKTHPTLFWTYEESLGLGFGRTNLIIPKRPDPILNEQGGGLAAFWSAMTATVFSLVGWEVVVLTTPENGESDTEDAIKVTTRKLGLRIMLLYGFAVFAVGLNVPSNDEILLQLQRGLLEGTSSSVFILSVIREGIPELAHFLNAFFIFSACTTGAASLYCCSRILHAVASIDDRWPDYKPVMSMRNMLAETRNGVPMAAVGLSAFFACLGFLAVAGAGASKVLRGIITVSVVNYLLAYAMNCLAYIRFHKLLGTIVLTEHVTELRLQGGEPPQPSAFRRFAPNGPSTYPFATYFQWMKAAFGLALSILLILFNGWQSFVPPFSAGDFVSSYISIALFIVLFVIYKSTRQGLNPCSWTRETDEFQGLGATGGPIILADPQTLPRCGKCHVKHRKYNPPALFYTIQDPSQAYAAADAMELGEPHNQRAVPPLQQHQQKGNIPVPRRNGKQVALHWLSIGCG